MVQTKKGLWLRLNDYHFDHLVPPNLRERVAEKFGGVDASTKAFAHKLTRKLGWETSFALRVINEYKKFLYLGVVSNFHVTPSRVIDQIWHEHLLFTQAYPRFCEEVLGVQFHHNPELLATDDQTGIFQAQYLATLELYRKEFNTRPPNDIWVEPKFNSKKIQTKTNYQPKKKSRDSDSPDVDLNLSGDNPLHSSFIGGTVPVHTDSHAHGEFAGFSGGHSGGAGAESSWDSHGDDSGSDSGSSSDSGSDGGGSSCSSGCGGGGCGGD